MASLTPVSCPNQDGSSGDKTWGWKQKVLKENQRLQRRNAQLRLELEVAVSRLEKRLAEKEAEVRCLTESQREGNGALVQRNKDLEMVLALQMQEVEALSTNLQKTEEQLIRKENELITVCDRLAELGVREDKTERLVEDVRLLEDSEQSKEAEIRRLTCRLEQSEKRVREAQRDAKRLGQLLRKADDKQQHQQHQQQLRRMEETETELQKAAAALNSGGSTVKISQQGGEPVQSSSQGTYDQHQLAVRSDVDDVDVAEMKDQLGSVEHVVNELPEGQGRAASKEDLTNGDQRIASFLQWYGEFRQNYWLPVGPVPGDGLGQVRADLEQLIQTTRHLRRLNEGLRSANLAECVAAEKEKERISTELTARSQHDMRELKAVAIYWKKQADQKQRTIVALEGALQEENACRIS